MMVSVLYFAALKDMVQTQQEKLDLPAKIHTLRDFADYLERLHPELAGRLASVRFARNEVFVDGDAVLTDGDVIAVIPPVAGG